jgi:hypothetical protein
MMRHIAAIARSARFDQRRYSTGWPLCACTAAASILKLAYPRIDMEGLTAIVALPETSDTVKTGALLNIGASDETHFKSEHELLAKLFRKIQGKIVPTIDCGAYFDTAIHAIENGVLAEEKVIAAKKLKEKRLLVDHSTYLPLRSLVLLARLNKGSFPVSPWNR